MFTREAASLRPRPVFLECICTKGGGVECREDGPDKGRVSTRTIPAITWRAFEGTVSERWSGELEEKVDDVTRLTQINLCKVFNQVRFSDSFNTK